VHSTFWEGAGGALISAICSSVVAVVAIVLTRNSERTLMREEMSLKAAHECQKVLLELRNQVAPLVNAVPRDAWREVSVLAVGLRADARRIDLLRAMIRSDRLDRELSALAQRLTELYPNQLTDAVTFESVASVARQMGIQLSEAAGELAAYLRAADERDRWRRLPPWRKYRLGATWPFVRSTLQDAPGSA
jgi:hypothetical protein